MSALRWKKCIQFVPPLFLTLYMAAQKNRLLGLQRSSVVDEIASVAMRCQ